MKTQAFSHLFGSSKAVDDVLLSIAREASRIDSRGKVFVNYSEDGSEGYLRGATGADPVLGPFGLVWADVADVRRDLRAIGVTSTKDEAASALCAAVDALSRGIVPRYAREASAPRVCLYATKAEYHREKRRRSIARKRAAGLCIICSIGRPDAGRSTCYSCGTKANLRRATLKGNIV